MSQYEFDAVRWCDGMKRAHFARKDFTTAENFKQTRMRIEALEAQLAAPKAAARPVATLITSLRETYPPDRWATYAWNVGTTEVTSAQLDALAALVGEG